jgi:hypothetical protein
MMVLLLFSPLCTNRLGNQVMQTWPHLDRLSQSLLQHKLVKTTSLLGPSDMKHIFSISPRPHNSILIHCIIYFIIYTGFLSLITSPLIYTNNQEYHEIPLSAYTHHSPSQTINLHSNYQHCITTRDSPMSHRKHATGSRTSLAGPMRRIISARL